jgi:hypothetical protein
VVHIAPGPIQTFTPSAQASIKAFVASGVETFQAIKQISFQNSFLKI